MSDLQWFDPPSDWKSVRLQRLVDLRSEKGEGYSSDPDYIGLDRIESGTGKLIKVEEASPAEPSVETNSTTVSRFEEGDVLFGKLRPYLAKVWRATRGGAGTTELLALTPRASLDGQFLAYAMLTPAFIDLVDASTYGAKMPRADWGFMRSIPIPLPPLREQRAIVADLDRETARIDALIAAKRELVACLGEKRQSLLARAVTRGLDPDAPMRDSGVPWLGEVPEHWEVEPLKRSMTGIEQGWSPQCENILAGPDEWGVLKVGAVNGGVYRPSEHKRLPDDLDPVEDYEIHSGDLLMSRANTTALVGSVAYVRETRSRLMLCDKLYRIGIDANRFLKLFVAYYFQSLPGRFVFERDSSGASNSMQNISQEAVRESLVPRPPLEEQEAIVAYLETQFAKLATVIRTTRRSIDLLQERRAALIFATVTGQRRVV